MRLKIAGSFLFALCAMLLLMGCGQLPTTAVATPDTSGPLGPTSTTGSKAPPTDTEAGTLPLALPTGGPELLTAQAGQITAMAVSGTVFPPLTQTPLPNGLSEENLQQTAIARATQQPIPTSEPAVVQQGAPASISTSRDGMELSFSLPNDTYMAGQAGKVTVYLKNNSSETLYGNWPDLLLLNPDGTMPSSNTFGPGDDLGHSRPPGVMGREMKPGEVISATVDFQVPTTAQVGGPGYRLWAYSSVSRAKPVEGGSDGIYAPIESGPLAVNVTQATPDKQLVAVFKADHKYWEIDVKTADGKTPTTLLWGGEEINAAHGGGVWGGMRQDPLTNPIKGVWKDEINNYDGSDQITYRFWVAAPGYTTAYVSGVIAGEGSDSTPEPTPAGNIDQSFPSIAEAETALNTQIAAPQNLPAETKLTSLTGHSWASDSSRSIGVQETYTLPNGSTIRLNINKRIPPDMATPYPNDSNEQPVSFGGQKGRLREQLGVRSIYWQSGGTFITIEASTEQFSLQQLEDIAASVGPLP